MKALAFRLRPFNLRSFGPAPQIVALLLVAGLAFSMTMTPVRQLLEQRQRIEGMTQELDRIEGQNKQLQHRIGRLKDPDFIEQEARDQIGLVRPGETAIVVMPPSKTPKKRRVQQERVAPRQPTFFEGLLRFVGVQ